MPCFFNHFTYHFPAPLYVDGDVIYSIEGTTQGDPLALPFYVLSTIPLIHRLPTNVTQAWYADDASACVVKFHICICGGTSFHCLDHILVIFQMHLNLRLGLSKISTYNMLNHFLLIHLSILPQMDDLNLELLLDLILLLHSMFLIKSPEN